jgi:integrase
MPRAATGTVSYHGTPPRWWARVTVHDEHGKPHRPWIDLERPDLKNTPEDKVTAKRLALKRAKKAKKRPFIGAARATAPTVKLVELEERWFGLLEKDPDLKPATVGRYKSSWAAIVKRLGKRSVADLTPPVLRGWVLEVRAEKSVSTTRNDVNALTRCLKDAIAQRWVHLTSNPMKDDYTRSAVPAMAMPEPDEIVQWSRVEVEKLLASPTLSDLHFGMLLLSVTTGVRDGELHGLRFGDDGADAKDPDVRRLYVTRQALMPREPWTVTIGPPKSTWGRRKVPLHPAAAAWLTWWKAEGWKTYVGRKPEDTDYLFPDPVGEPWRPRAAELIRDLLEAADMAKTFPIHGDEPADFTWHALRRTFASLLSDAGVLGEIVDYLLGQSPRSVRGRHYTSPPMTEMARAVGTLRLALPTRPGVAPSAPPSSPSPQSSRESSKPREVPPGDAHKTEQSTLLAPVAQRIEQRFPKPKVGSSTLPGGAIRCPLGPGGWGGSPPLLRLLRGVAAPRLAARRGVRASRAPVSPRCAPGACRARASDSTCGRSGP